MATGLPGPPSPASTAQATAFRPARASRRWLARARRVFTPRGHGESCHRGELAVGFTTAETRRLLRANGHWTSVYTSLQENLGGEAGTVVLTGGADSAVEEDSADGDSLQDFGETSLGWF
jgi:hypothetical protein